MKVYKCGSKAITVIGSIEGIITAVNIRFKKVNYEFSYFKDGKHSDVWLEECELKFNKSAKQIVIGYK